MAHESGFVQRKSRLNGSNFARLMAFSESRLATGSLLELTQELKSQGIEITKQSLDERINDKAVAFLKQLLERAFYEQQDLESYKDFLPPCKAIRIKDSTSINLPNDYGNFYQGSGGKSSKSCVKIQFEYDFKTGRILDLSIGDFTRNDATDSIETIDSINQGELVIRDLGYVSINYQKQIEQKQAYYLNRIKSNVQIWIKDLNDAMVPIDLARIEKEMRKSGIHQTEYQVCLGADKSIGCRLILECLPMKVREEKLRKARKAAKREGRELGDYTIARIGLNIFVTNMSKENLPGEHVWSLYRLRWQIELVFKTWKTIAGIDKIKKVKRQRFECYLYGKLLWVILGWKIFWIISKHINKKDVMVSIQKFLTIFKIFCREITRNKKKIILSKQKIKEFMEDNKKKWLVERRNEKLSCMDIITRLSVN